MSMEANPDPGQTGVYEAVGFFGATPSPDVIAQRQSMLKKREDRRRRLLHAFVSSLTPEQRETYECLHGDEL